VQAVTKLASSPGINTLFLYRSLIRSGNRRMDARLMPSKIMHIKSLKFATEMTLTTRKMPLEKILTNLKIYMSTWQWIKMTTAYFRGGASHMSCGPYRVTNKDRCLLIRWLYGAVARPTAPVNGFFGVELNKPHPDLRHSLSPTSRRRPFLYWDKHLHRCLLEPWSAWFALFSYILARLGGTSA